MKNKKSLTVTFSKFTKAGEVLTKILTRTEGKITSDASQCFMSSGTAKKVTLELSQLPSFLSELNYNQAISLGVVGDDQLNHHCLSSKKYESLGYSYPSFIDETGAYATRSLDSISESSGSSLIMFDYDPVDGEEKTLTCEEFLEQLSTVLPEIKHTSYVRTFSTSSSLYSKETEECVVPANGFHIYMVMQDGRDLKRFGKDVLKRLMLAGLGSVKVNKRGALLKRSPVDVMVFSPERLVFEAGALISTAEDFYQDLPTPEFHQGTLDVLDTKKLLPLSVEEEVEYHTVWEELTQHPDILALQNLHRENHLDKMQDTAKKEGVCFDRAAALRNLISATDSLLLPLDHTIKFDEGQEATVAQLLANPEKYDGLGCLDPIEEFKGAGKARFYANINDITGISNPKIHSFVGGCQVYSLNEIVLLEAKPDYLLELEPLVHTVTRQHSKYLTPFELQKGITLIKAEKGVGKSTLIAKLIPEKARILGLTPRVSLTNTMAEKFGLTSYQEEFSNVHQIRTLAKLAICYNSLYKIEGTTYEIVVIDEGIQLVRHLKSMTVKERVACLRVLKAILRAATYVIFLDADISANYLQLMLSEEFGFGFGDREIHLVDNSYKPAASQSRVINEYLTPEGKPDEKLFLSNLLNDAKNAGLFYGSNSKGDCLKKAAFLIHELSDKTDADELHEQSIIAEEHFITEVAGRRVITLTSKNTSVPEVRAFTDNINAELRKSDILICSPSLGTGVSIDAVEGKAFFEKVYCRFSKRAGNTPQDCAQHMARVRDCRTYHVVVLDTTQKQPIEPSRLMAELLFNVKSLDGLLGSVAPINFDPELNSYEFNDQGWAHWNVQVTAIENEERNNFAVNLRLQLEYEGYTYLTPNGLENPEDVKAMKLISAGLKEKRIEQNMNAYLLTDLEAEELRNQTVASPEEERQLRKKFIQQHFGFSDVDELTQFCGLSDNVITQRKRGIMLRAQPGVLLVQDVLTRVSEDKQAVDQTVNYNMFDFSREFLVELGITFDQFGVPCNHQKVLTAGEKDRIYNWLLFRGEDCKGLLGVGIPQTHDRTRRSRLITSVLNALGLKFSRATVRREGNPEKVSVICPKAFDVWVKDGDRAVVGSRSLAFAGFSGPPSSLLSYTYNLLAGTSNLAGREYLYISKLNDFDYKLINDTLINAVQTGRVKDAA